MRLCRNTQYRSWWFLFYYSKYHQNSIVTKQFIFKFYSVILEKVYLVQRLINVFWNLCFSLDLLGMFFWSLLPWLDPYHLTLELFWKVRTCTWQLTTSSKWFAGGLLILSAPPVTQQHWVGKEESPPKEPIYSLREEGTDKCTATKHTLTYLHTHRYASTHASTSRHVNTHLLSVQCFSHFRTKCHNGLKGFAKLQNNIWPEKQVKTQSSWDFTLNYFLIWFEESVAHS